MNRTTWRAALLVCAIVAAGCSANGSSSSAASSTEILSECFVIKRHKESMRTGAHQRIYVRTDEGALWHIGTTSDPGARARELGGGPMVEGLKESVLAISGDGRSIVFIHDPDLDRSQLDLEGGIYRYEFGRGSQLVYADDRLQQFWSSWPKPLPADVLVFQLRDRVNSMVCLALSADGRETPLALLGATELHEAVYRGRRERVEALIDAGRGINAETYWGHSPLQIAIVRAQNDIALGLLAASAEDPKGVSLSLAVKYGRTPVVEAMLQGSEPRSTLADELYVAVAGGQLDLADVSQIFGGSALEITDRDGTLRLLVNRGADPNGTLADGTTPFHEALSIGDLRMIQILLDAGADPNIADDEGNTALHVAARSVQSERLGPAENEWQRNVRPLLELLVASSSNIDAANGDGLTPLHLAVQRNRVFTAEYLISHGADDSGKFIRGGMGPRVPGQTIRERIDALKESDWWTAWAE